MWAVQVFPVLVPAGGAASSAVAQQPAVAGAAYVSAATSTLAKSALRIWHTSCPSYTAEALEVPPLLVLGEERAQVLVERGPVAAGERRRGQRRDGGRARHIHGERDLAEIVARPEHPLRPELAAVADREQPPQDDVEVVAFLVLQDDGVAGPDLASAHVVRKLRQLLAGQLLQQPDLRELGHSGGRESRHPAGYCCRPWPSWTAGGIARAAAPSSAARTRRTRSSAPAAGSSRTEARRPRSERCA